MTSRASIMQLLRVDVVSVTRTTRFQPRKNAVHALRERITRDGRIVTENSDEKEFNILEATQVR